MANRSPLSPIRYSLFTIRYSLFANSFGRLAAIDHDGLDLAGAVGAAKRRRLVVFFRGEAGDALLKGWKLDHHEALKLVRTFHHLEAAAAGQDLAAIFGDDGRYAVGVFFVLDRIVDLRARDPIGWHSRLSTVPSFRSRADGSGMRNEGNARRAAARNAGDYVSANRPRAADHAATERAEEIGLRHRLGEQITLPDIAAETL